MRTFVAGSAALVAATLVACNGSSSGTVPPTSGPPVTHNQKPGAYLTIVINRTPVTRGQSRAGKKGARPQYISTSAQGLQIAVTPVGSNAAPQMVYADVSPSSALCTTSGSYETCTISIPTLAASETVSVVELDQTPLQDTNGYGTGFTQAPNGPNILAVGSTTANITLGGTNTITLGLAPVAGILSDGGATTAGLNFNEDPNFSLRLVATGGVVIPAQGLAVYGTDATGSAMHGDPTPLPYVDVNGTPQPISVSVSPANSGVTVDAIPAPAPNPLPSFGPTASIPDDSYVWHGTEWVIGVESGTSFTSPATITVANNLSAINPFTGGSYASSLTYTIDPVTVSSPSPQSISLSAAQTSSVVGTDPQAPAAGMDAESAFQAADEACLDVNTAGQKDASVTPAGPFNTGTSTQTFTITPIATGTCSFVLYDVDTGVVTQAVTMTVAP